MDYGKTNRDVWEKDADGALCGEETCGCELMESTSPHEMSPRGEGDEKSGGCQGEDRGDAGSPYAWYADEWVEPVVFRTEQQMEVSCPFPGTPPEGGQNTDPYGLVDSSYLYEDCYKSQDDDNNSIKDLTPTNYDRAAVPVEVVE